MVRASRTFGVYVESTFSDFVQERYALQSHVFPKLRVFCENHGCRLMAIDTRWGISKEAAFAQNTMGILMELVKSLYENPGSYFIFLLGDRYGWQPIPEEIESQEFEEMIMVIENLEERELLLQWYGRDDNSVPPVYYLKPRSDEYRDGSLWYRVESRLQETLRTAVAQVDLEFSKRAKYTKSSQDQVFDAVINFPGVEDRVFCFFRNITGLPYDVASGKYDWSARDFLDMDEDGAVDWAAQQKLDDFKLHLRERLTSNIYEYEAQWIGVKGEGEGSAITTDHIEKLCEDIYLCLSNNIEMQIVQLEAIDVVEEEVEGQRFFGEDRARFFTGSASAMEPISKYVESDDPHPFCIYAEGGIEITALVASAVKQVEAERPEACVVFRYLGATPASLDRTKLLEGLCRQICRSYGRSEPDMPSVYRDQVDVFFESLTLATEESPLFIFLDSVHQLDDYSLAWIPERLPEKVRMVLTTRPGPSLVSLRRRLPQEYVLEVSPMPEDTGEMLLDRWLEEAGRTLQDSQRKEILNKFQEVGGNPLYLKLAFEEARLWRSDREDISLSSDIEGIIRDRYERLSSHVNHGQMLVSKSLGYLAASRQGLSEDELLDILSQDDDVYGELCERYHVVLPERRLPFIVWYRFYFDLASYLSERMSQGVPLLGFYHRELEETARHAYLDGDNKYEMHRSLADYFEGIRLCPRKMMELPWQLSAALEWERLYFLLAEPTFLSALWESNQFEVKTFWTQVEEASGLKMTEAYQPVLSSPMQYNGEQVLNVAILLRRGGHPSEALPLQDYLIGYFRESENKDILRILLDSQVLILRARGDLDGALVLLMEQEKICKALVNENSLARCLFNQAIILNRKGMRPEAIAKAGEAYQIAVEHCHDSLVKQIRGTIESLSS